MVQPARADDVQDVSGTEAVHRLIDRQQIIDLVHDYCRFVDDNRPTEAARLFSEDCTFVSSTGRNGTVHGRAAVHDRLAKLLSGFSVTSHHVSNISIDFDGDRALGITYLYAWHRFVTERPDAILWARYHDVFVRTGGQWLIAERTLRVTADEGLPFGWQPPLPARGQTS